jgi:hypothetical protein
MGMDKHPRSARFCLRKKTKGKRSTLKTATQELVGSGRIIILFSLIKKKNYGEPGKNVLY